MRIAGAAAAILCFVVPSSSVNNFGKPTTALPVAAAKRVHALFDLGTPAGGPFPSDRFTVAEAASQSNNSVVGGLFEQATTQRTALNGRE